MYTQNGATRKCSIRDIIYDKFKYNYCYWPVTAIIVCVRSHTSRAPMLMFLPPGQTKTSAVTNVPPANTSFSRHWPYTNVQCLFVRPSTGWFHTMMSQLAKISSARKRRRELLRCGACAEVSIISIEYWLLWAKAYFYGIETIMLLFMTIILRLSC